MMQFTKRFCCLALLTTIAGCGFSMANSSNSSGKKVYLGTWRGKDDQGQTMVFTLKDGGQFTVTIGSGKKSFTKNGTYQVDTSTDPAQFDFKLSDRREIKTILKIIDKNKIAFENIDSSDSRPSKLGNRKIVLKRQ